MRLYFVVQVILAVCLLVLTNCATRGLRTGYFERGSASWYGPGFQGKKTASGERFNMNLLTAAHPSLPLGTIVKVRSLTTGREVTVKINDRGPFANGRIIDLSRAAALKIGMIKNGHDEVEVIGP
jgi:rare lipoprotein A